MQANGLDAKAAKVSKEPNESLARARGMDERRGLNAEIAEGSECGLVAMALRTSSSAIHRAMARSEADFRESVRTRTPDQASPKTLYKYATSETARSVQHCGKLRFNSPFEFNDGMDCEWNHLWPMYTDANHHLFKVLIEEIRRVGLEPVPDGLRVTQARTGGSHGPSHSGWGGDRCRLRYISPDASVAAAFGLDPTLEEAARGVRIRTLFVCRGLWLGHDRATTHGHGEAFGG